MNLYGFDVWSWEGKTFNDRVRFMAWIAITLITNAGLPHTVQFYVVDIAIAAYDETLLITEHTAAVNAKHCVIRTAPRQTDQVHRTTSTVSLPSLVNLAVVFNPCSLLYLLALRLCKEVSDLSDGFLGDGTPASLFPFPPRNTLFHPGPR